FEILSSVFLYKTVNMTEYTEFQNEEMQQHVPPSCEQSIAIQIPAPSDQTIIHVTAGISPPPDDFGFALFVTLCCCLPFGIVGLVKSSEVRMRATMGDTAGAELSSNQAKKMELRRIVHRHNLYWLSRVV
ncbi:CD225/dispanin family protein, partial [Salmonella sp. s55004]|uniref:CD225/dispanin family protein n=1 Tax=Salmonella sp. s55004 TaxID=3159675 RepID=UPI00397F8450